LTVDNGKQFDNQDFREFCNSIGMKEVFASVYHPQPNEYRILALEALNKYQAQTKAWRDNTVIPREFKEGDLVLTRTIRTESRGKLEPKWEGPYIVKTITLSNAYRLTSPSGEDLEHS
jgi:hypothetical protein